MQKELTDYFRCPEEYADFRVSDGLSKESGYFSFGRDAIGYGRSSAEHPARHVNGELYDVSKDVRFQNSGTELPFDPAEVAANLRYERYASAAAGPAKNFFKTAIRRSYYLVRPLMPVGVRKHLQKAHLTGWEDLAFPKWPVDTSVDTLLQKLLALSIQRKGGSVPFIWFWPEGKSACALMTHDVEEQAGLDFCPKLMDINDSFGVPASFQVVPEERYSVPAAFLDNIRSRGFEVNVHDLNHDGQLYWGLEEFKRRAQKINRYGREFRAVGFRAGVLYRNQEWFDLLDFEYDSSVPNVAHLDPQRGGCCTVMPYFVGKLVELPVTAIQDYSLFHIVNSHGLELWQKQFDLILRKNGLINVIVHPDYITQPREQETYKGLLGLYAQLRRERNVWNPLPREANTWWRQRSQMKLVQQGAEWRIEGLGHERAVVTYASLENDRIIYSFKPPSGENGKPIVPQEASATVV